MLTLKFLLKFLNLLNKDASPRALAGGMALGAIIGITPFASLHNLVVLILILMLTVNFSGAILAMGVFKAFSWMFDPLFNRVGYALLTNDGLKGLWTTLYNTPVVPWTRFNNTLTLGSLVCALVLFFPLYLFLVWGVKRYRETVLAKVQKWRIVQILKASKLYGLYASYSE
jgi:uncharacterized protein (TIGR03546 family)